jgi:hypothetical protein
MDDEILLPPPSMPNLSANYGGNRDRDRPPSSAKKNIMSNKNNIKDGDDEFDFWRLLLTFCFLSICLFFFFFLLSFVFCIYLIQFYFFRFN